MNDLVKLIERELGISEMVLTDPLTLQRLKAERIARVVTEFFTKAHREMLEAQRFGQFPDICTFVTREQADEAVASVLSTKTELSYVPGLDAGVPVG